jgi:hypothetical protein
MTPQPIFTLRQLPLPAKIVIAVFMVSVGLGYFSAMVQLHLQHSSRSGEPLPSPVDVVAVFAGVEKFDPSKPTPVSKLERLVMGPIENAPWNGSGSMAAAFFHKSEGDFKDLVKDAATKPKVMAEREGERQAVKAWINLPEMNRKSAYDADQMTLPDSTITPDYAEKGLIKIKSILNDRCARCHAKGESEEKFPLDSYAALLKYIDAPKAATPDARGYVPSPRQVSVEKLTQSTHAHLLSFSMLFALTGLCFAFTSYPRFIRMIVAPMVLVFQIMDISCWWLARIDGVGPMFAMAIMGTGGVVGLGLTMHILGTLFDLFDKRGRLVVIALMVAGAGGFGALYFKVIEPALAAEKVK